MGISGILSNTIRIPQSIQEPRHHWRWIYLASFSLTVNLYVNFFFPSSALEDPRSRADDIPIASWAAHALGGFLVGLGTKMANGCTTGHGICGISRMSTRSLVATATFTGTSILTTFTSSPLRKWSAWTDFLRSSAQPLVSPLAGALFSYLLCQIAMTRPIQVSETKTESIRQHDMHHRKTIGAAISGALFATGLAISGMTKKSKVHDFLCLSGFSRGTHDATLMTVLMSGILASWISYQFIKEWAHIKPLRTKSLLSFPAALTSDARFEVPTSTTIDAELVSGAAIFGVGWGLTGICPGPAVYAAAAGVVPVICLWLPSFVVGSTIGESVKVWFQKRKMKSA
jgi:hypothetical protein